jgi:outer membrane protein assembly factor BamB
VYVGSGTTLRALDAADGSERWATSFQQSVADAPPVIVDNILYTEGQRDLGSLYAVDAQQGDKQWRLTLRTPITAAPVMLDDVGFLATQSGLLKVRTPSQ